MDDSAFKSQLAGLIPHMRAFARNLCGDPVLADDLAQDAMLKAWEGRSAYREGSNMKAWCFTILRNVFYSEKRRSWRVQALEPGTAESVLVAADDPTVGLDLLTLRHALQCLPVDQREALILVGAGAMTYEEAASICQCAVGTVKSRVNRARRGLMDLLEGRVSPRPCERRMRAADAFEDLMSQVAELAGNHV